MIKYGNESITPRDGKWDLRGKKFVAFPKKSVNCWGFLVFNSPREIGENSVKSFVRMFIQTYAGHGGTIEQKVDIVTLICFLSKLT